MQTTVCGDYCFKDNCRQCNDERLNNIQPLLVSAVVDWIKVKRVQVATFVEDGLMPQDNLDFMDELLQELGSPQRKVKK